MSRFEIFGRSWRLRVAFVVFLCTFALSALASPGEEAPAARSFLNEGLALFQAHRYAEAVDWFGRALQQDPSDADAELLSGRALWELKRPLEAIDHLRHSVELRPAGLPAQIHLCKAYWELERFGEAATACRRAAETASTSSTAFAFDTAGSAFFRLGRFEEAWEMFRRATDVNPNATTYYNLSRTQAAMGQLEEAVESIRTAIRLQPDFDDARISLGFYSIALRSYRESIATFKQVLVGNPSDERAHLGIAIAEKYLGHVDKAITAASKAVTIRPCFAFARYILGILQFESGDTRSALVAQETLRSLDPALAEEYSRYLRGRYVVQADGPSNEGSR